MRAVEHAARNTQHAARDTDSASRLTFDVSRLTSDAPRLTGSTRLVGVLGDPIAHSRSPAMHNAAFAALGLDWCYVPLHVVPERLEAALRGLIALGFVGANVTIPHKERAAELAAELTPAAQAIGAVNTLTVQGERLLGDNTDWGGLLLTLEEAGVEVAGREALVLGAGGSARAIVYALAQAGAQVTVANRTVERAEELAAWFATQNAGKVAVLGLAERAPLQAALDRASLVINTTSVGMHPGPDVSPLPEGARLAAQTAVLDLVYAPRRTALLRQAAASGCRTMEGLRVLVYQGALSFKIWTGLEAPVDVMARAVEA